MINEEIEKQAEEYIIKKYNLTEMFREPNPRDIKIVVHTDYEEEYKIYLDGLAEGRKEVTYMKAEEYDKYIDACRKNIELEKENEEAKELIKTLLLIADNKVSQMEFQLCVADAKQFLNSVVENIS